MFICTTQSRAADGVDTGEDSIRQIETLRLAAPQTERSGGPAHQAQVRSIRISIPGPRASRHRFSNLANTQISFGAYVERARGVCAE